MRRLAALIPVVILLAACPRDRQDLATDSLPVDTMPQDSADLSTIVADLPPVDTATPPAIRERAPRPRATITIPDAPEPLLDAVRREQTSSQFCFTEFGQKRDPALRGAVTMIVTVGAQGITGASVGAANWSGSREAARAVNQCLIDRAQRTWTVSPGVVQPGRYQVGLVFRGG